jgi:hypothetical protein
VLAFGAHIPHKQRVFAQVINGISFALSLCFVSANSTPEF